MGKNTKKRTRRGRSRSTRGRKGGDLFGPKGYARGAVSLFNPFGDPNQQSGVFGKIRQLGTLLAALSDGPGGEWRRLKTELIKLAGANPNDPKFQERLNLADSAGPAAPGPSLDAQLDTSPGQAHGVIPDAQLDLVGEPGTYADPRLDLGRLPPLGRGGSRYR